MSLTVCSTSTYSLSSLTCSNLSLYSYGLAKNILLRVYYRKKIALSVSAAIIELSQRVEISLSRLGFETGTFECLGSISRQWRSSFILYAQSHLSNKVISINKKDICCCYCAVYYCTVTGTIHSNAYGSVCCIITCLLP